MGEKITSWVSVNMTRRRCGAFAVGVVQNTFNTCDHITLCIRVGKCENALKV